MKDRVAAFVAAAEPSESSGSRLGDELQPTRCAIRYHGGKWVLAPKIVAAFPQHRTYVEPFAGGASVLLRKPRSQVELINDLDDEIVTLHRVLRDRGEDLRHRLELTPYCRAEFELSYERASDPVEQARRTIVRCFQGHGANAFGVRTGFRSNSKRNASADWARYSDALHRLTARLRGVIIERADAFDILRQHDRPDTLFYIDPPYCPTLRGFGRDYRYELSESDHVRLAAALSELQGAAVISGYRSDLYDTLFSDWIRIDFPSRAEDRTPRTECIWLSRPPAQQSLFT